MEQLIAQVELPFEAQQIREAALLFRAINHKLRQQMLRLLHLNQRMTVKEIYNNLKLEQPVVSQQLAILRRAKLVNAERESKNIFYSVNYKAFEKLKVNAGNLLMY
jgi:DNA-binding transcriptional ArsR family regulator